MKYPWLWVGFDLSLGRLFYGVKELETPFSVNIPLILLTNVGFFKLNKLAEGCDNFSYNFCQP